jgi:hypothetical protein
MAGGFIEHRDCRPIGGLLKGEKSIKVEYETSPKIKAWLEWFNS